MKSQSGILKVHEYSVFPICCQELQGTQFNEKNREFTFKFPVRGFLTAAVLLESPITNPDEAALLLHRRKVMFGSVMQG